jgi:hypothetical protein
MIRMPYPKTLIEAAYRQSTLPTWTEDEAGPFQTVLCPGRRWRPVGDPARYPHEYIRNGTAKQLTLFHPATGEVRVKGVLRTTNAVLHPWLKAELEAILATLPVCDQPLPAAENRQQWERWRKGSQFHSTCQNRSRHCGCFWFWTTSKGTALQILCSGWWNTASCRSTHRSEAVGSIWQSQSRPSTKHGPSAMSRLAHERRSLIG